MKKYIGFLKFNTESEKELLDYYSQAIAEHKKVMTVTPNLDIYRIAYNDRNVRKNFEKADILTIDGKPILWIAKWLKVKDFKYKISGSDLAVDLLTILNNQNASLYLFGGKEGVAELAKQKIQEKYPNINIVGTKCPKMGYEKDEELCVKYINDINAAKPNVVFLCTGTPKTENFFFSHYNLFEPACYFSVGATIDFIAGTISRAPKWMSRIGLEWFYRLTKDFKRLFKRYLLDGLFLIKIWFLCHFNRKEICRLHENNTN